MSPMTFDGFYIIPPLHGLLFKKLFVGELFCFSYFIFIFYKVIITYLVFSYKLI